MEREIEIHRSLIELYNQGIEAQNSSLIRRFLNDNSFENLIETPQYYLEILQLRAAGFSLFGDLHEAGEEFRKGYAFCSSEEKWMYGLNWALQFMAEFSFKRGNEKISEAMTHGVEVVDQTMNDLTDIKHEEFYRLCLCNVRAFMLLCSGKKNEALLSFKDCSFSPVPIPDYNDKESLQPLFANFTKGLAVAIEMKDIQLLMNLLKVISIDDEVLLHEENLFKLFYETLISAFDLRVEFINEFNSLFKIKESFSTLAPNFFEFLTLIGEQDFKQLNNFFQDFYQ